MIVKDNGLKLLFHLELIKMLKYMLSVNPWIVLNDHLNINDLKKYFNFVLN